MKTMDVDLSNLMTLDTDQTVTGSKSFTQPIVANKIIKTGGTDNQILPANGDTTDVGDFLPKYYPHAMVQMIIEPNDDIRNQSIKIMKNNANWDSFVLTGCNADPSNRDGVWKMGSTSSQFKVQKQEDETYDYKGFIIDFDCMILKFNNQLVAPLPTPPIDYTIQSLLDIGALDFFYLGLIKPKFSGIPRNLPLNAVLFAQKVYGYPIDWTGAIVIDCYIDVDGHIKINTMCQLTN
ncbi:MAG: hypothetical protein EZS28_050420 [Streblomastix strix]|uniref:Uncharacterized protein n=1 Tax=Streblomastix strix TaxID=222440 RepID=A0A5J4T895_9EUKA|nr:MAG: hypothetical protein EZS28_050420 [Streblomastix strix]